MFDDDYYYLDSGDFCSEGDLENDEQIIEYYYEKGYINKNKKKRNTRKLHFKVLAVIHETEKAILLRLKTFKNTSVEVWLPKAMVKLTKKGDSVVKVIIPFEFAMQKNLWKNTLLERRNNIQKGGNR